MSDIFISTSRERFEHKLRENVPEGHQCFWSVNGTPKRCGPGDKILFSDGDRVRAKGVITDVEEGEIWFTPLTEIDEENPVEAFDHPGFKYVEQADGGDSE